VSKEALWPAEALRELLITALKDPAWRSDDMSLYVRLFFKSYLSADKFLRN